MINAADGGQIKLTACSDSRATSDCAELTSTIELSKYLPGREESAITEGSSQLKTRAQKARVAPVTTSGDAPSATETRAGLLAQLEARAELHPDALAVEAFDGALSYRELWRRAASLAEELRSVGVRPGDPVGLCLPRSCGLVVGALAVLAAGGCYVALDPVLPDDRLQFVLVDAGARVAVAGPEDGSRLRVAATLTPPIGDDVVGEFVAPHASSGNSAAYLVYTSGSTGTPKGVVVEHASVLNLIAWHQRAFEIGPGDRCTLLASPGFDAAVWEIWPCLAAGASLHVPLESLKTDPAGLRDWLLSEGITVSFVPTPLAETMFSLNWPDQAPLRYLLTGGDRLVRRPKPGLPFIVINNYGVSEAAVVSTSGVVAPAADDGSPGTIPTLGSAIDGVQLSVLDDGGQAVSEGAVGELVISGISVARGYVGRPDLDRAQFRTDAAGVRSYRTGDLVRLRTDGELEYLGRLDDQVQIRGFRVELGEVITTLDHHPAVRSSAVVAVEDGNGAGGAQSLRAFVVWEAHEDDAGLRAYLLAQLPQHMVPAEIVTLTDLPTMANGKADRTALLAWAAHPAAGGSAAEPRNDLEVAIAAMVAERLGLPQVGIDENFFLLGGHSMLGAQLITRIGEQYGIEMSLRALFEHPTVAEIAEEVERLLLAEISAMDEDELLAATAQLDDEVEA